MYKGAILLLILLWNHDSVKSVRLLELRVPTHEREGGMALLGCQFDMEGDILYSVKWYKDNHEFYRYLPRSNPHVRSFPVAGVQVDEARSSSTVVALVHLTRASAGMYRCEVSGEAPQFTTAYSQKYITIHLLPDNGPSIIGQQQAYYVDDYVALNCTSPPSRPPAQLKWLINDKLAPLAYVRGPWERVAMDDSDAVQTTLQLMFNIVPSQFIGGVVNFKCQSTIAPLYQRETNTSHNLARPLSVLTHPPNPPEPIYDTGFASSLKQSVSSMFLPVFVLLVVL